MSMTESFDEKRTKEISHVVSPALAIGQTNDEPIGNPIDMSCDDMNGMDEPDRIAPNNGHDETSNNNEHAPTKPVVSSDICSELIHPDPLESSDVNMCDVEEPDHNNGSNDLPEVSDNNEHAPTEPVVLSDNTCVDETGVCEPPVSLDDDMCGVEETGNIVPNNVHVEASDQAHARINALTSSDATCGADELGHSEPSVLSGNNTSDMDKPGRIVLRSEHDDAMGVDEHGASISVSSGDVGAIVTKLNISSGDGWGEPNPSLIEEDSEVPSDDTWGETRPSSFEKEPKPKVSSDDGWGETDSGSVKHEPKPKVSSDDGWGETDSGSVKHEPKPKVSSDDGWGETDSGSLKHEPKPKVSSDDGWGETDSGSVKHEPKPKVSSDDGWGETDSGSVKHEPKPKVSSDDGWGETDSGSVKHEPKPKVSSDDGWGETDSGSLKHEPKPKVSSDDGWGETDSGSLKHEPKPKVSSDDGWGETDSGSLKHEPKPKVSSDDGWGETDSGSLKHEPKPKVSSDDGWGETDSGSVKHEPKPKPKVSSGDSWGDSGSSKPSDDFGWGSGGGAEGSSAKKSGDGWGASSGNDWGDSGTSKPSGDSAWGSGGGSSSKKSGDDWGFSFSGGGSSDFKSGGAKGKGCFKCGEEGHMSRECPSGVSRGGKGCFKCGEEGHMSRECPSGGSKGGKGCFKCGEEGHMSRECPSGVSRGGKGCFKCGEEGHMSRECPSGGSKGGKGCFKCGEEGHMSRECPSGGSRGPSQKSSGFGGSFGGDSKGTSGGDWGSSSNAPSKVSSEDQWGASPTKASASSSDWGSSWGEPASSKAIENSKPKASSGNDWGDSGTSKPSGDSAWGSGGGGSSWGDDGGSSSKKSGDDWGASSSGVAGSSGRKSGGSGVKGCFKCGEEGHMSRECPSGGSKGGKGCHKCGKEGHIAKECSEPSLDADGKPRPPVYKPPDLNENDASLYDTISTGVNFDRYDSMPCSVSGEDVPKNPKKYETFEEAFTSETIRKGLEATGIKKPTPIQKYGMRIVMAGRDLMACAQTGSGKTLAFILPILQDLYSDKDTTSTYGKMPAEPRAVIVSPTRELAVQIYKETYKYSAKSIVKVQIIYGGTSTAHQRAKLSEGCHILVGTPGRLLDFLNRDFYNFSNLKYFVLDEADRMIDQGFIPDVRKLVTHPTMPPREKRQTLMFSATFPGRVQETAAEFLVPNYLFLTVGILGAANSDVEQTILKVEKFDKRKKLIEILGEANNNDRTMIFVEAKKTADFLASFLSQSDYKATSIHGDRYQHQREEALADLKSGKFPILVATSVASRGLDIKDVRHVINYDLPKEIDDYVHRIGRTGRVGNKGKATSFYDPAFDKEMAENILQVIKSANQPVPEWLEAEVSGVSQNLDYGLGYGGLDIRDQAAGGYQDLDAPKSESLSVDW